MKHIKLFENFSREYLKTNNNSLVSFYADKLGDFWLEKELLEKLEQFEARVDSLFSNDWNLNRGRNHYNGDFFALNVKVYNYPDEMKFRQRLALNLMRNDFLIFGIDGCKIKLKCFKKILNSLTIGLVMLVGAEIAADGYTFHQTMAQIDY
jgi:hypothetical protein